jgi:hypothetical protein
MHKPPNNTEDICDRIVHCDGYVYGLRIAARNIDCPMSRRSSAELPSAVPEDRELTEESCIPMGRE